MAQEMELNKASCAVADAPMASKMRDARVLSRWWVALAAVLMQLCLGAAYGWSIFVKPLVASEHWPLPLVAANFSLAILCLGIGTVVGGLWQDRIGPRVVASIAGLLYGGGYMVASFAVAKHSLAGLYLGYGLLSGIGMGMGYVCPIALLAKWFPDRRGLMTGIAVCGYGMGALVMSTFAAPQIAKAGVSSTFLMLGIAYLILVVATAQFYRNPPSGWVPKGWRQTRASAAADEVTVYPVSLAVRTSRFWLLWLMLFISVSAGIMIISQASPLAQQLAGLTPVGAAGVVGVLSIFNGVGRVVWAGASDYFGHAHVWVALFLVEAAMLFTLPHVHSPALLTLVVGLVGFAYGGGFGVMPSLTASSFGAKNMGGIYGLILLAWSVGAVPSPMLIAYLRQRTGSYTLAIESVGVVVMCAAALPMLLKSQDQVRRSNKDAVANASITNASISTPDGN